ncbi:MAG: FtsX-like permease family protein [Actinomycetota bacterium]|nr:FtsX-like permease family protein [Actinomycetota bacterium]
MTKLALRSLLARKLRTALTSIAVLLGVAMVAGTFIETDEITSAFDDITAQSVEKIDVIVSPSEEFSAQMAYEPPTIPAGLVKRISRVPGVAAVQGELTAQGHLVVDGEVVETMGAPAFVSAAGNPRFDPTEVTAGERPDEAGEVGILAQNAEDNGIELGDEIEITTKTGVRPVTVVGTFDFGEGGAALGGTTAATMPIEQVRDWFRLEDEVSSISIAADAAVDPSELSSRVAAVLPATARSQTASENAAESAKEINDQIGSFLTPALLALSGAAVLVGAFIIFNTFSITVAQRSREFAMLRALGVTRSQIVRVVVAEAAVIGLVASGLGILAGIGFAAGINALFDASGYGIPHSGAEVAPRTIVIGFAVGLGVTVASSVAPALRAMRVPPIAAMSKAPQKPSRRARKITRWLAGAVLLLGALLIAQGLFGSGSANSRLGGLAGGSVLGFIGLAMLARYFVGPMAGAIGKPVEAIFGTSGRLARENAERNPGRTAVTSAALMVGLGLVVFVAVFAAGIKSSIAGQIDDLVRADMVAYGQDFQPFPTAAKHDIREVDGVSAVVPQHFDQIEVDGRSSSSAVDVLIGVDLADLPEVYAFDWLDGEDALLADLGERETIIEEQFAERHGLEVGDSYTAVAPEGGKATLTARGIYRDPTVLQGSLGSLSTLRELASVTDPISMLIAVEDGADVGRVEAAVKDSLERYPTVTVENKAEYQDTIEGQLDQIVYLLYALLAMSILISIFGIANSLFLSIHERTGELGVLRAVGATRAQVRRVIRYESVITAIIGGVLGTVVGVLFGWLVTESLSEFGFGLEIPVGQLVVLMLVSVLVGIAGAVAPARRASRVDVLEAVQAE